MDIDLLDPSLYTSGQPHEQFAWLRAHDPLPFHAEPGGHYEGDQPGPGFWAVTRYDDVKAVGRDPETFSSLRGIFIAGPAGPDAAPSPSERLTPMQTMMLMMDPPRHADYRRLTNRGFTPRAVTRMSERIRELSTMIVDDVIERGECDLVTDVAGKLPSYLVAELLGIPLGDGCRLYDLTERIHALPDAFPQGEQAAAVSEMLRYAFELAARKRAEPQDDIASMLLSSEIDGRTMNDMEFGSYFILLVDAGGDTTRNLVAGGMQVLFDHPDQRLLLTDNLDALLPTALEEMLRYCSPVVYMRRTATRDTELSGRRIACGDKVVMFYGSANRDESVFADPDTFDVTRSPNEHVAFGGGGPHFCLGAHLARLEIAIMFRELLTRMPDLEPAGPAVWQRSTFISGPQHMAVRFTPGARSVPA